MLLHSDIPLRLATSSLVLISAIFFANKIQALEPDDVITELEGSLKAAQRIEFSGEHDSMFFAEAFPEGLQRVRAQFTGARDGTKWKISLHGFYKSVRPDGAISEASSKEEFLATERVLETRQQVSNEREDRDGTYEVTAYFDTSSLSSDPGNRFLISGLEPSEYLVFAATRYISVGALSFGFLPSDSGFPIWRVLRESNASLRPATELIDDHETVAIEAKGRFGQYTLWLDPDFGYLPRKLKIHKSGTDFSNGRTVEDIPVPRKATPFFPAATTLDIDIIVDNVKLERVDNLPLISGLRFTEVTHFEGGTTSTTERNFRLSEIESITDESAANRFVIEMNIPNGTPVSVRDQRGIQYQWSDGEIVKQIDPDITKQLDGLEFKPPEPGMSRGVILILANVGLALAIVVIWFVLRRRSKRG